MCDASCHFILSSLGTWPDVDELVPLPSGAPRSLLIECPSGHMGYESGANHRFAREQCGVPTLIPAKLGRQTDKPASG